MLAYRGIAYNIEGYEVGRVDLVKEDDKGISYLLAFPAERGFGLIRCGQPNVGVFTSPAWYSTQRIILKDGDIVRINSVGDLFVVFENNSDENAFLVTDNCNSRCVMCPQPPCVHQRKFYEEVKDILSLVNVVPEVIAITGGEPLLYYDDFVRLIGYVRQYLPGANIQLLTNARVLKDAQKALEIVDASDDSVTFCVPLYADTPFVHDALVGVNGAFWETMEALHHLGKLSANIELRNVILSPNVSRLQKWADFVSKNMPFVGRVALMGMEPIGLARKNIETLWVDPVDYQDELKEAVKNFVRTGIPVSIFNHQLCVVHEVLWQYCVKSICNWKVRYIDMCTDCMKKELCGGIFFAGVDKHSRGIQAIK
ncbi:His-Xaa-Ser system radical SAM maturase HxsC [Desulfobaculum xiamenense]|uniref:His-Xaa-Ser system radical SAM maturase HxsC n=1 Tax=Desulfobaculum xiamenense TaxID=995050 RepID=A0A846QJD7_9BACT|nr:His-Xaa-Ser system radical SAM maturase HxsC [Desulfobaculum xiamenense]NJB67180.1 His-Xaa-Ser system radical SAM maturase HxsC [Desulfobaculum xiamenense]